MATGSLHRMTGRLHRAPKGELRKPTADLTALFVTPVPPFNVVFPTPASFSKGHPIYAMHRAANRVYRHRLAEYTRKGRALSAAQLMDFIREDVTSNLLAVERVGFFGPLKLDRYVFLKGMRAWLAPHRDRAEAMLMEFQRQYRKKKERVSAASNNDVWGTRPAPSEA